MNQNKISTKKLFQMLAIEMFAMTSLMYPAVITGFSHKNGLPVLLAASGSLFLAAIWYLSFLKNRNQSPDYRIEELKSVWSRTVLKTIYTIRYFLHGLFLMLIFVNLIEEVLLPGWSRFWILLPVILVIFLTTGIPVRVRGRILEVLFPWIFLPVLLVLLPALFQLDYRELAGQLWEGNRGGNSSLLYQIYGVLLFYQPVEFVLFLAPEVDERVGDKRKSIGTGAACLFVVLINVMMYVAAIGMFGTVRTGDKLWSALYIMQSVRLPGKFLERLDILFLVFWIFSIFALFSAYMYYGGRFWRSEKGIGQNEAHSGQRDVELWKKENFKSKIFSAGWLALTVILTLIIKKSEPYFHFFIPYKMWVDFPFALLAPVFIYGNPLKKVVKKGVLAAFTGMLCMFSLGGCGPRTDIEDYNYVMTMAVENGAEKAYRFLYETADLSQTGEKGGSHKSRIICYEADSLKEAEEMNRIREDKELDFGHLKGILFEKSLFEDSGGKALLDELESHTSIAGTTLLFFTDQPQSVLELGEKKAPTFGEYGENLISNQQKETELEDTLSELLRDRAEQKVMRNIVSLKAEKEQLVMEESILNLSHVFPEAEGQKDNLEKEKGRSQIYTLPQWGSQALRFHIRAEDDSMEAQRRKNAVKDRILPKLQNLLAECRSKESSMDTLRGSLLAIESWTREACEQENYLCDVKAYLCRESFPMKMYGNLLLPSGEYDALRIDLGKGEGTNWWCMLYPSLCMMDGVVEPWIEEDAASSEADPAKEREENEEKTENRYHIKWRIQALIREIFGEKSS